MGRTPVGYGPSQPLGLSSPSRGSGRELSSYRKFLEFSQEWHTARTTLDTQERSCVGHLRASGPRSLREPQGRRVGRVALLIPLFR